jgi:hypothetical protein
MTKQRTASKKTTELIPYFLQSTIPSLSLHRLNGRCSSMLEKSSVDHTHSTRRCVQSTADAKISPAHGATI